MNAFRILSALPILLAAGIAWAQPALDRVEQQLKRQVQAGDSGRGGAAAGKQPGYLGIVADDREDRGRGARLLEVLVGSPAAKAGLKVGDLVTAVNDQQVRELDDMTRLLELRPTGATVTIQVNRDGADRQIPVTLGERPAAGKRRLPQFGKQPEDLSPAPAAAAAGAPGESLIMTAGGPKLGIRTLPITPDAQQQFGLPDASGALVSFVGAGSPAEKAGIPVGSAIVAVDAQAVDSPEALAAIIRQSKAGRDVDLTCIIRGQTVHKRAVLVAAGSEQAQTRTPPDAGAAATLPPPGFTPQDFPQSAGGAPADPDRIEALERRIAELESRLQKLEAARRGK